MKAIMADVNHLANELLEHTAAARDDVVAAATIEAEKVCVQAFQVLEHMSTLFPETFSERGTL